MKDGSPRVAVVGRPNVGKSTLVNRLAGRRVAIAHEMAGVTRDRVEVPVSWGDRAFVLVDTGGFVPRGRGIEAAVSEQASRALRDADLVILVGDATTGPAEEDLALSRQLQRAPVPALVAANKVDSERQDPLAAEFYALGLGEPIPVSALHGRGTGELLDRILELIPEGPQPSLEEEARFALVGRPNVGKSSLFNRLVAEDRAVVHEQPGTTRDTVDSVLRIDGQQVRFLDTAGFRRPVRTKGVEYYSLVRSIRAIDASHVAALVVDAPEGVIGEDKRVAARVAESGRGLLGVLNKWDLVPSGEREERFLELKRDLQVIPGTPVVRTSALTGSGVNRVLPGLLAVHRSWMRRVPTAEVNRVLETATSAHPPPRRSGRVLYGTQVTAGPPTFVLFGAGEPIPSYRRYLENALREAFRLDGVPIRLRFRKREGRGQQGPVRAGKERARPDR
jgi:GTP-binding protein